VTEGSIDVEDHDHARLALNSVGGREVMVNEGGNRL
jgi:hypothetical protein